MTCPVTPEHCQCRGKHRKDPVIKEALAALKGVLWSVDFDMGYRVDYDDNLKTLIAKLEAVVG